MIRTELLGCDLVDFVSFIYLLCYFGCQVLVPSDIVQFFAVRGELLLLTGAEGDVLFLGHSALLVPVLAGDV